MVVTVVTAVRAVLRLVVVERLAAAGPDDPVAHDAAPSTSTRDRSSQTGRRRRITYRA
jgi:hypothetical protein